MLEVEQRQCSDWREVSKGAVVSFNGDDENSTPDEGRDITKSDGGPSERWKGTKVLKAGMGLRQEKPRSERRSNIF